MRAKKSFGQNFLRDDDVISRIVGALDPSDNDNIIEIGPGRGALTDKLLATLAKVTAIEIDRELVPILRTQFHFQAHFNIVEADVLDVDFGKLIANSETRFHKPDQVPDQTRNSLYKLVGNLPYNISTPILQRLIDQREHFSTIVLMLQREVVERITASPGGKERGFLSVLVENAFVAERLFDVAPSAFQPVPKVWSSVVRLTPKSLGPGDDPAFRRLVSISFAQKRKTILNNLKHAYKNTAVLLAEAGIDSTRRAETLSLDEWFTLAQVITQGQ